MTVLAERLRAALAERFHVEKELGRGGMATVFLAHDLKHDRDVALKVLHPELASVIGSERFFREIQIAARLNHPHILPLLDSGQAEGLFYYVMPLMSGETLRDRLERERQLPVAEAVRIGTQVAAALTHAHRHGVIHRDIKPENILLHEGEALVADFGIAFAVSGAGERLTETGLSIGTPQYMSPEQGTGERTLDARSDIYSLGCVVYEMLAGEPPFTGVSSQAIIAKLMTERPVRLRTVRDAVPEAVDDAVAQALAKVPADRPPSAEEFAAALIRPARSGRRWTGRRIILGVGAVLGIVALSLSARTMLPRLERRPAAASKLRQVTFTGDASDVSLSPDGKTIAYVADTNSSLVVEDLSSGGRAKLAQTTRWMRAPRWSRDGTQLLYGEGDPSCYCYTGLFVVPRLGGQARDHSLPKELELSGPGAYDFGSDDTTLVVGFRSHSAPTVWIYFGATPESIQRIADDSAIAAGRLLRIDEAPWQGGFLGWFRLSPDGRWLAFAAALSQSLVLGLVRPTGGALQQLVVIGDAVHAHQALLTLGLAWAPDGGALYYTTTDGATGAVMRQSVDLKRGTARGKPTSVLENLTAPSALDLAADGSRLVIGGGFDRIHVVMARLGVPGKTVPELTRFSCGTAACWPGSVSPNKQMISYLKAATSGDVTHDLYVREVNGSSERKLASGIRYQSPRFTADSRELAFIGPVADSQGLIVMDVISGKGRELWRGSGMLGVTGPGEVGRSGWALFERRKLILVSDSLRTISTPDASHRWYHPVLSPDGKWVAVQHYGPDGVGIYRVDRGNGRETPLLLGADRFPFSWSRDGRLHLIRFDTITNGALAFETVSAEGGNPKVMKVFPRQGRFPLCVERRMDISQDGELAVCSEVDLNSDVYVLDNFGASSDR
jgi:eukaryotic-like serine/threonine-protein kinase